MCASVDAPPRMGGVAELAFMVSHQIARLAADETVFVGPSGTYFDGQNVDFKVLEDYNSDTRLRAGPGCLAEDERIEDLFSRVISGYSLNHLMLFHSFYYAIGGMRAMRNAGGQSSLFIHGTELTSQIPNVAHRGELAMPQLEDAQSLPARLLKAIEMADHLFTNSHYSRMLIEKVCGGKKVNVVGCGIDTEVLKRETDIIDGDVSLKKRIIRERMEMSPAQLTMVSVGRLVPHKNIEAAIDLAVAIPQSRLIIIGDGPRRAALEAYARDKGVAARVTFLGAVDETTKWRYLRAADIGILASNYDAKTGGYEGFGIVMLEYAAAGCVVYSNGKFGMHDFVERFHGGLVGWAADSTVEQDAARLVEFMQDRDALGAQVAQSREVVRELFNWQSVAERMLETWDA